ncbi:DUF262 domain-containing protein [Chloroflexota bacterium]
MAIIYSDRIKPTDYSIRTFLEELTQKEYQIPTFQREIVWERDSVKKLWDSIFRYYPIGSILIWKTNLKLQNHRSIGGHIITNSDQLGSFNYILDGQQRTTSLLTALYGGKIEGKGDFDPTLYFDLTVEDDEENEDHSFGTRFLFWNEIDDRGGDLKRYIPRKQRYDSGLIIKLKDVMHNFGYIERQIVEGEYKDYDDPVRKRLRLLRDVLDNYRLSFIELKGIKVVEVCQIFERINQEGKPLDIFDIVVAKTFRLQTSSIPGFYLREMVEDFRSDTPGNFSAIDDLTYLQILAVIINRNIDDSRVNNITEKFLNRIKAKQIEEVWSGTMLAIQKMFDFFDNFLYLKGPRLIPYRYLYMSIASYLYNNPEPNYELLKKYFWYYSFHNEDLLTNTTHLRQHVNLLNQARSTSQLKLGRFLIDKQGLRNIKYSTSGRLSNAILCLFANQEPRDWSKPDRRVITEVYYLLTDKPNLHHVFPTNYITKHPGVNKYNSNSLMNIAYLTQLTNLEISDKNPIDYMREYDKDGFGDVLSSHLINQEILEWVRMEKMPEDGLDRFIEKRIDLILDQLRIKLPGITFDVIDTQETESEY